MFKLILIVELGLSYALEEDYSMCTHSIKSFGFQFLKKRFTISVSLLQ